MKIIFVTAEMRATFASILRKDAMKTNGREWMINADIENRQI